MPLFSRKRREPSVIMRADRAREAGQWQLAAGFYRMALDRNPRNPPIWIQYGHALKECGNRADAEAAYRAAIAYDPEDADAHLQLGHVLKLQGKTADAQTAYRRALALDGSLADAAWELSQLNRGKGPLRGAVAAASPTPTEPPAIAAIRPAPRRNFRRGKGSLISRADRARDARHWEVAADLYRMALDRNPNNPPIWVQYGHALKESGRLAEAEDAYRAGIARDASAADPHLQLGHLLQLQGKQEEAERAYLCALSRAPRMADPLNGLGVLGWSDGELAALQRLTAEDAPLQQPPVRPNGSGPMPRATVDGGADRVSGGHPAESRDRVGVRALGEALIAPPALPPATAARPTVFDTRDGRRQTLLVSILSFGRPDNSLKLIADLPRWLHEFARVRRFHITIVIRNNDPQTSFSAVSDALTDAKADFPDLDFHLVTHGPNLGFGPGHNENFKLFPADYLLVLNDDLSFRDMSWLYAAVDLMHQEPDLALVGSEENPRSVSPFFGNGHFPHAGRVDTLRYVEASVMIARGTAFEQVGMFNDQIPWVVCEDADLSFRAQSLGYRIGWIPIPHDHQRSTSINSLPSEVKASILEHNRATLISLWRNSISTGKIGQYEILDVWSAGVGDVFCILPHLQQYLSNLAPRRRATTIINTSAPALARFFLNDDITIENFADLSLLALRYGAENISSIRTIRDLNYSIPTHISALLCGALNIPLAPPAVLASFWRALAERLIPLSPDLDLPGAEYCVVHLEITREDHSGRSPSEDTYSTICRILSERFDNLVVIGLQQQWVIPPGVTRDARIFDYRGRLSLLETIGLIAKARYFVGVDSLPAHVAQAFGLKCALLFGSVHPLARVWDQQRVWPITASLPCIGCYHLHLEPSMPFCMRRDEACMSLLPEPVVRPQIEAMVGGIPFDWSALTARFRDLQATFYRYLRYHPAPPERVFRGPMSANEKIGNLIFEMTDKMADMVSGHYQTAAVTALRSRVSELERDLQQVRATAGASGGTELTIETGRLGP